MAERIVDAALSDGGNTATFFLTDHYVIYDYANDRVRDGVRPLTDFPPGSAPGFPASFVGTGPANGLDAALRGKGRFSDASYYFRGANYMRLRTTPAPVAFDPADGRSTAAWNLPAAFAAGVDAAFNGALNREPFCYFFKNDQYVRYIWDSEAVDQGYPKPISNMVGMPAAFAAGIDAAVDGGGAFADAGYLFKNEQYQKFQWVATGEPHAENPIAPIQGNWTGLAELLLAGKAKSQALEWLAAARPRLVQLAAGTLAPADVALVTAALLVHFKTTPADAAGIATIATMLGKVEATLRDSANKFRFRTDDEARADSVPNIDAAYTAPFPPGPSTAINFTRNFMARPERNRASSVIHEAVHVNDADSASTSTHINEWYVTQALAPALGLPPVADRPAEFATRYDTMTPANSLHNPASYATFCRHIFFRADNREVA